MNKFLSNQIEKALGANCPLPDNITSLFKMISDSYDQFESDRTKDGMALKEKEELINAVYSATNDAIIIIDDKASIVKWDSKAESLFGWKESEVRGMCLCDTIIPTHLRDAHKEVVKCFFNSENNSLSGEIVETTAINSKNQELQILLSLSISILNNGKHLICFVRDMSSKKEAELALSLSEKRFRRLIENSGDAICLLDNKSAIKYSSPSVEKILGYNFEEMNLRTELNTTHSDDFSESKKIFSTALANPSKPISFQYRKLHKDGSHIWVEGTMINMLDDESVSAIVSNFRDITERKKSELALVQSESKYRSLFEEMADGVYKSTHDGKFVDVNPALVKMLGYDSREELLSIDIKTKLYFEASERDSAVLQDNTNGLAVFRLRKKDGSEIWFEERGSYVSDGKGSTIYHEGILRDVTKRIHTEFELMRSQKETADYKKALNQSLIVSITDKNGNFTFANSNFCNISKFTVEELTGKSQAIINSEIHTIGFVNTIHRTIASGKVWRGEVKHKAKDGNFYWVDSAVVPFIDEFGKPYQFLTISIDVTERKLADETLLANELKFRSMIEHNEDMISMFDAHGNFTYVSPAITKEFDFTFEECLTLNSMAIIHPEDRPAMQSFLLEVMKVQSVPFKCPVFRIRKKNGTNVWVEGTLTNLLKNEGVKAIVANFKDITERREYEEKLKNRNAELLKSNMELDKFVYSVSHDLRAPLSSMLGVIGISEEETKEVETKQHLAMLKASIKKLDLSISDILDYSRNSRLEVNREKIDLRQLLNEITDNLKSQSKNRNKVAINVELNEPLPFISDKNRVNIILNNIISNAIIYQDPKNTDPLVNIKVDMSDTETNIVVKDNGIGISSELQEKIFDMFFRGSENSDGSGLGLYIVKESVEKLNGKIEVKSIPGKGSEFIILIPHN